MSVLLSSKSQSCYPVLDISLRRWRIFFIAIKYVFGNLRFRCCFCNEFYAARKASCTVRAEKIYLLSGKVILLQESKQRHRNAIPPVGITQKNRIIIFKVFYIFHQSRPASCCTFPGDITLGDATTSTSSVRTALSAHEKYTTSTLCPCSV